MIHSHTAHWCRAGPWPQISLLSVLWISIYVLNLVRALHPHPVIHKIYSRFNSICFISEQNNNKSVFLRAGYGSLSFCKSLTFSKTKGRWNRLQWGRFCSVAIAGLDWIKSIQPRGWILEWHLGVCDMQPPQQTGRQWNITVYQIKADVLLLWRPLLLKKIIEIEFCFEVCWSGKYWL